MHGLDEISTNCLYYLYENGLDVLYIKVLPHDVRGMHKFSVSALKILPVNVCSSDVIDSVDVTSESNIPGLNVIGPELTLNGVNGLNAIWGK